MRCQIESLTFVWQPAVDTDLSLAVKGFTAGSRYHIEFSSKVTSPRV